MRGWLSIRLFWHVIRGRDQGIFGTTDIPPTNAGMNNAIVCLFQHSAPCSVTFLHNDIVGEGGKRTLMIHSQPAYGSREADCRESKFPFVQGLSCEWFHQGLFFIAHVHALSVRIPPLFSMWNIMGKSKKLSPTIQATNGSNRELVVVLFQDFPQFLSSQSFFMMH